VLLQLLVAACTGLLMWGIVRMVANIWHGSVRLRRVRKGARSTNRIGYPTAHDTTEAREPTG
jgi:hypothetical protein